MTEWQPIETAPKDGSEVLGFGHYQWGRISDQYWFDYTKKHGTVGPVVMRWWEDDCIDEPFSSGWETVTKNPYRDGVIPTHWMPLPEPPK